MAELEEKLRGQKARPIPKVSAPTPFLQVFRTAPDRSKSIALEKLGRSLKVASSSLNAGVESYREGVVEQAVARSQAGEPKATIIAETPVFRAVVTRAIEEQAGEDMGPLIVSQLRTKMENSGRTNINNPTMWARDFQENVENVLLRAHTATTVETDGYESPERPKLTEHERRGLIPYINRHELALMQAARASSLEAAEERFNSTTASALSTGLFNALGEFNADFPAGVEITPDKVNSRLDSVVKELAKALKYNRLIAVDSGITVSKDTEESIVFDVVQASILDAQLAGGKAFDDTKYFITSLIERLADSKIIGKVTESKLNNTAMQASNSVQAALSAKLTLQKKVDAHKAAENAEDARRAQNEGDFAKADELRIEHFLDTGEHLNLNIPNDPVVHVRTLDSLMKSVDPEDESVIETYTELEEVVNRISDEMRSTRRGSADQVEEILAIPDAFLALRKSAASTPAARMGIEAVLRPFIIGLLSASAGRNQSSGMGNAEAIEIMKSLAAEKQQSVDSDSSAFLNPPSGRKYLNTADRSAIRQFDNAATLSLMNHLQSVGALEDPGKMEIAVTNWVRGYTGAVLRRRPNVDVGPVNAPAPGEIDKRDGWTGKVPGPHWALTTPTNTRGVTGITDAENDPGLAKLAASRGYGPGPDDVRRMTISAMDANMQALSPENRALYEARMAETPEGLDEAAVIQRKAGILAALIDEQNEALLPVASLNATPQDILLLSSDTPEADSDTPIRVVATAGAAATTALNEVNRTYDPEGILTEGSPDISSVVKGSIEVDVLNITGRPLSTATMELGTELGPGVNKRISDGVAKGIGYRAQYDFLASKINFGLIPDSGIPRAIKELRYLEMIQSGGSIGEVAKQTATEALQETKTSIQSIKPDPEDIPKSTVVFREPKGPVPKVYTTALGFLRGLMYTISQAGDPAISDTLRADSMNPDPDIRRNAERTIRNIRQKREDKRKMDATNYFDMRASSFSIVPGITSTEELIPMPSNMYDYIELLGERPETGHYISESTRRYYRMLEAKEAVRRGSEASTFGGFSEEPGLPAIVETMD